MINSSSNVHLDQALNIVANGNQEKKMTIYQKKNLKEKEL